MLTGLGRHGFEDAFVAVPGKSEFGMDTLVRKMQGWVGENGENLEAFLATLHQADTHVAAGITFYLQSWLPDDVTPIASVMLNYKGLRDGGTPIPDVQTDIVSAVGRITKSYLDENDGLGITLRNTKVYALVNPEAETFFLRPVYTVSASSEFEYKAVETRYRYIKEGQPSEPEHTTVQSSFVPTVEKIRIQTSDGMTYGRERILSLDMVPVAYERVVSWSCKNVIGSPYFECEEVIRKELVDPDELED